MIGRLIVLVSTALGVWACDAVDQYREASEQLRQAGDMAQASMYYAQVGVDLNAVESQGFPPVMEQLTASVSTPAQREAALAAADALVDRIDEVVERHRPSDADGHPGYQAAKGMVAARRQAVAQLRQSLGAAAGPEAATQALVAFSDAWMRAQQQFMASVGGHSQQIFGPAAQRAAEETGLGHVPIPPAIPPTPPTATGAK